MNIPPSPNKRFCTIAMDHHFVTTEQIKMAMEIQIQENITMGKHRQIGRILFEEGIMSASQIQTVLAALKSGSRRDH